jgi:hypothetical protein
MKNINFKIQFFNIIGKMFFSVVAFIILIIIINYKLRSRQFINVNNLINTPLKNLKILTYNIQRLPYTTKPNIDIEKILSIYDIVCFQENFCSFTGSNRNSFGYNCIHPPGSFYKLIDSGLSVYSKYEITFIDFIKFDNLVSIDRLSDKGFLVFKINDLYIVNTHLQAVYKKSDDIQNGLEQLNSILEHCKDFEKVLICGDFNIDLREIDLPKYGKILTKIPTHWSLMNGVFNSSSATKKENYLPFYYDGAFYKNIFITNVKTEFFINDTDHLGVSFEVFL